MRLPTVLDDRMISKLVLVAGFLFMSLKVAFTNFVMMEKGKETFKKMKIL